MLPVCSAVVRWVKIFISTQLQGGLRALVSENTCKNINSQVVALTQLPHFKDVLEANHFLSGWVPGSAAATVPDTGAAGSLSLFVSIAAEVGTSSPLSCEPLGDLSSIIRQPATSDSRKHSFYCSVNTQTWAHPGLSVPQIKDSPGTGAVLSTEDARASRADVKWSLPKQNPFRYSSTWYRSW